MFEAFKVAVRISLINQVTSGLLGMSQQFARVHAQVGSLQQRIDKIRLTAMKGGALVGVGAFGLSLIDKTLGSAKEYTKQLSLMNAMGMTHLEIAEAVKAAWASTKLAPTSSAAENLKSFGELRSVFGTSPQGMRESGLLLPYVSRLSGVMEAFTGQKQEKVGFDMVKSIELRTGVMTEEALKRNAELMSRAIIGMRGTVTVADFHGALKMSKIASAKFSDDFVYNYLPTLMQELKTAQGGGAQSAGTVLQSLYRSVHGRMMKSAMPYWLEGGLLRTSDIIRNATGQWQARPGSVAGTKLFEENPYLWVQQYLRPAVDRITSRHHVSPETAINSMFSDRNAAFAAYNMYLKAQQYERDKVTINTAQSSFAAYQSLLKTNPDLAGVALHKQWENMMAVLGFQIMPTLLRWTTRMISGLQTLTSWFRRHEGAAKTLMFTIAGLSAALMFGGTVMLLKAAFGGLGVALSLMGGRLPFVAAGLVATQSGLAGIAGISGLATLGPILLAAAAGLAATYGIAKAIKAIAGDPNVDPTNHPGQRFIRHGRGAVNGEWVTDPSLDQSHAGQTWHRLGRAGGYWTDPSGNAFDALGRPMKSRAIAPAAQSKTVEVTTNLHMDGQKVAKAVSKHQANAGARAINGGAGFDTQRHPLQPSMASPQ